MHKSNKSAGSASAPKSQAIERAVFVDPLEKREAIERVITLNAYDIGRPERAKNVEDIILTAERWLETLEEVPNSFMEHNGRKIHVIERVYAHHMKTNARPQPLAVSDLVKAWDGLQKEWAEEAKVEIRHFEPDEFEVAPLVPRPLTPEEEARRAEMCRQARQRLGFGAPESHKQSGFTPRPTDYIVKPMSNVAHVASKEFIPPAPKPEPEVKPKPVMGGALGTGAEPLAELLFRLGPEIGPHIDTLSKEALLGVFNREFFETHKRDLTAEDVAEQFPAFYEQRRRR